MELVPGSIFSSGADAPSGVPRPLSGAPRTDATNLAERLRELARTRAFDTAYVWLREDGSEQSTLTFAELDARARALGARLEALGLRGARALLLYSPGLEFIAAFLGCLYAGVVAVPLSVPRSSAAAETLRSLVRHAGAAVLLSDGALLEDLATRGLLAEFPEALDTARLPLSLGQGWRPAPIDPEAVAFLQYTSGSTGTPRGVLVSHRNLVRDEEMIAAGFAHDEHTVFVGWLPHFHDMGLVGNVLQPLYLGGSAVLMAPAAFVQKPVRWLRAISRYRGTTAGAPNFAYDLCCAKVRAEELAGLDLSSWRVAFNGSEPVEAATLERFAARFAAVGFRREALYPCYGLAEATLFVSGGVAGEPFRTLDVSAEALRQDRVVVAPPDGADTRRLVSCGRPWLDQEIRIVEERTRASLADDRVGEIWLAGGNVARGYRGPSPAPEDDPFSARLATGEGPFLRTGDLGFRHAGELYVTGRCKDVLIVRGRNHYPQDLERCASAAHPWLRPGFAAAFTSEAGGAGRLVLVLEVEHRRVELHAAEGACPPFVDIVGAVRAALVRAHGLSVQSVVLIAQGSLPRTTSGKVRRQETRALWLRGALAELARRPVLLPFSPHARDGTHREPTDP